MALFVKQDETRTRYQEQIAAELQEKLRQKAAQADMPDGVEDSQFVKGTKHTSNSAWIWVLVILGIVALGVALVVQSI